MFNSFRNCLASLCGPKIKKQQSRTVGTSGSENNTTSVADEKSQGNPPQTLLLDIACKPPRTKIETVTEEITEKIAKYIKNVPKILSIYSNIVAHICNISKDNNIKKMNDSKIKAVAIFTELYCTTVKLTQSDIEFLVSKESNITQRLEKLTDPANLNIETMNRLHTEILQEICEIYKSFNLEDSIPEFIKEKISNLREHKNQIANESAEEDNSTKTLRI